MMTGDKNQEDRFIPHGTPKTVVMACTHPYWSALQVGSQHLARQFARNGWQVHYLSAPISPLHLPGIFAPEVFKRFKSAGMGPTRHEDGKIRSYVPFSLLAPDGRPLLRSRTVTHYWHKTMLPSLKRLLAVSGLDQPALLYIDNISYHFLQDALPQAKSVFRVMDMHERFPDWKGRAGLLARKIATKSDLTIYSARDLEAYAVGLGAPRTLFVPNGVDYEAFAAAKQRPGRPDCLKQIPDPVLLYTGMIDSRLDFDLVRTAARRQPQISLVFAGPLNLPGSMPELPANVYFTGPVSHDRLPGLMQTAAAGLIPFDVKRRLESIRGIRPLKLFEYLAAGIPVISSRWPEIEELNSPAWFYENADQFVDLAQKAVHREFDAPAARDFAEKFDWKHSFRTMMEAL